MPIETGQAQTPTTAGGQPIDPNTPTTATKTFWGREGVIQIGAKGGSFVVMFVHKGSPSPSATEAEVSPEQAQVLTALCDLVGELLARGASGDVALDKTKLTTEDDQAGWAKPIIGPAAPADSQKEEPKRDNPELADEAGRNERQ